MAEQKTWGILLPWGHWVISASGTIFWTTSRAVAEAQYKQSGWAESGGVITSFEDANEQAAATADGSDPS